MKEQDAAHSFEKTHPDFPEWIETEAGKGCLQWPISDPKYLRNRLFWAFDAGRNCVWDQYTEQKKKLTRLRSELQQQKDEFSSVRNTFHEMNKKLMDDLISAKSELQQERELRKELIEALTNVLKVCKLPTLTTHGLNHVEKAESLIKKAK